MISNLMNFVGGSLSFVLPPLFVDDNPTDYTAPRLVSYGKEALAIFGLADVEERKEHKQPNSQEPTRENRPNRKKRQGAARLGWRMSC